VEKWLFPVFSEQVISCFLWFAFIKEWVTATYEKQLFFVISDWQEIMSNPTSDLPPIYF